MADPQWGFCKDCKWWQVEPGATLANAALPNAGLGKQRVQSLHAGETGARRRIEQSPPDRRAHALSARGDHAVLSGQDPTE